MNEKIKQMVQDGFASKRIAKILQLPEKEVKKDIEINNYKLIKDNFTEDKIEYICNLYEQGVSAKNLGIKFSIDKRRIQKWAAEKCILRDKSSSHRFTEFNQHIFDEIDTREKAYWLGFLYADAYNCNDTNTVALSLQIADIKHLQKLAKFIGLPLDKIVYSKNKEGYEYYTLKMYSKHLCQTLNKKGCPQAKSFIIKYPEWLNKNLTVDFIRGMFDGDGALCKRKNKEWKWSLATTKECGEVIKCIILNKIKLNMTLSYISKTENNTYELESNGNEKVFTLADWLYKDSLSEIRLDRKYQRYLELIEQQNNRSFKRQKYKVSDLEKLEILDKLNMGHTIINLSEEYKLHPRTIAKIK